MNWKTSQKKSVSNLSAQFEVYFLREKTVLWFQERSLKNDIDQSRRETYASRIAGGIGSVFKTSYFFRKL